MPSITVDPSSDAEPAATIRPGLSAYAAIGARILNFGIDVEGRSLQQRGEITLPSRVQFACPHSILPILYAACADRKPDADGQPYYLCALKRDAAGDLTPLGEPVTLPARPIAISVDAANRFVLTAYSAPAGLTVHELRQDGTIGEEVPPLEPFNPGSAPHQIRTTPSNRRAIIAARGKKGFGKPTYVAGALQLLRFNDGVVENVRSISPDDEDAPFGFGPRHVEFHPTRPFLFTALEEQSALAVFRFENDEIDPHPLFVHSTLADPANRHPRQDGGMIQVHPNGRYVYVGNRNDGYVGGMSGPSWLTPDPIPLFAGGDNTIAVFEIDQDSGEPTLLQNADSRGLHPRCFALDPTGQILVVGTLAPTIFERDGERIEVPASLSLFAIEEDGRLSFIRRYDLDVGQEMVWWMGIA